MSSETDGHSEERLAMLEKILYSKGLDDFLSPYELISCFRDHPTCSASQFSSGGHHGYKQQEDRDFPDRPA